GVFQFVLLPAVRLSDAAVRGEVEVRTRKPCSVVERVLKLGLLEPTPLDDRSTDAFTRGLGQPVGTREHPAQVRGTAAILLRGGVIGQFSDCQRSTLLRGDHTVYGSQGLCRWQHTTEVDSSVEQTC